jgi:hypothetical protein
MCVKVERKNVHAVLPAMAVKILINSKLKPSYVRHTAKND